MPDKLDKNTKQKRANKLRNLGKKLEKNYKNNFKNKKLEVIIENKKDNIYKGKTEYYFDIEFTKKQIINNKNPQIKNLTKVDTKSIS